MFGDVLFVLEAFVAEGLFGIVRAGAVQGYPVNDVSDQMKAIERAMKRHLDHAAGRLGLSLNVRA